MEKFYVATIHNISKALGDVEYPTTKAAVVAKYGAKEVQTDFDKKIKLEELLKDLPTETISCAAELYNGLSCVMW